MKKNFLSIVFAFGILSLMQGFSQDGEKTFLEKAKPDLITDLQQGRNEFWIVLNEQTDISGAKLLRTKEEKGNYVFNKLTGTATTTQKVLLPLLNSRAESFRQFWIANAIFVKGDSALAKTISTYPQVKELLPNTRMRLQEPVEILPEQQIAVKDVTLLTVESGIAQTNAPLVWNLGYKGQGVVVGGQDTGVEWDHPTIQGQYRGWDGISADHNYNWHDAIHSGSTGPCPPDSPSPCDDTNHGTHTTGTMVGDDQLGNQIGMSPSAKWIAARNMDAGAGTPVTYLECFQWFLAPTDLNDQNPMPSKAPHVINNSWACDAAEGCNPSNFSTLETAVNNLRAAGIVVVASAGNDGPGCNSIVDPPSIYEGSFTVGSVGTLGNPDAISMFSSRGSVDIDGSGRTKPDVCAPGYQVRSSIPTGSFATYSGTSMAGPHVAGAVALLISAVPSLAGQVDNIESILEKTAVQISSTQTCDGISPNTFPNNTVGYGLINILDAVNYALNMAVSDQNAYGKGVTVYPTPATDKLFFRFENFREAQADISFLTTTGQTVFEHNATTQNNSLEIPISTLAPGLYFYSIKTNKATYHGKFVKK